MTLNQPKKLLWPVFALILLAACTQLESFHEDDSLIKDDVSTSVSVSTDLIQPLIDKYAVGNRFWLVSKNPIPANTVLKYGPFGYYNPESEYCGTLQSPGFDAWLVYISGDTLVNGPTDGLCLFVNVLTGGYEKVEIPGQVCDIEWDSSFYEITEGPIEEEGTKAISGTLASPQTQAAVARNYAVIISGGADMYNNDKRFWNDCQYVYKRLTQDLGYDKSHIYCLVSDGTDYFPDMRFKYNPITKHSTYMSSPLDFDDDGVDDIKYSATKQEISKVFNELRTKSSSIDHLLIFVTDHGSDDGRLCLWGQMMSPSELNAELNKLSNVKIDIVMGQCFSGAFLTLAGVKNRSVSTACNAYESSYAEGLFTYDFFLRAWTDAFDPRKKTIVDANNDTMVSLGEAFNYAKAHDSAAIRNEEHPQFASSPNYYGYLHDLQGKYYEPVITGSDNLRGDNQYTYTISGLPSSVSVSWSCSSELRIINQTSSTVTVQSTLPRDKYVDVGARIYAHATIDGEDIVIEKYIFSIWRSGWFSNQNKIYYTADGDYTVETGYGAYDYQWGSSNSTWTFFPPSGSSHVRITAPYPGTATVYVAFKNPFGETVAVGQEIRLNY